MRTRNKEHGIIPQGGVLISKNTGIPISLGGALSVKKEDDWKGPLPKGWDDKSRSSFYDSMSQECEECGEQHEEGPTTNCIDKIDGNVDNPGAFCAALRDQVTGDTTWRGDAKKK